MVLRTPWMALFALFLLTGCGCFQPASRTPPPASIPAGPFQATLTALVEPPRGESVTLTLRLFQAGDGRLGAQVSKLDHDVASVAMEGDRLAVWLPRAKARFEGSRRDPGLPPWLSRLDLLADEVGTGPVPEGALLVADGADWAFVQGDARIRLRCEPDGRPTLKVITAPEGVIRLEYGRPGLFNGIPRPGRASTILPDGTALSVTIGSIRAQPEIPEKRLRLPAEAAEGRRVDAAGLADALAGEGERR
jgi:hypothetical protein